MFKNLIGQEKAKRLLSEAIQYSQKTGNPIPNILFESGMGGTGKTTFVKAVANETGRSLTTLIAQDTSPDDVGRAIAHAGANSIIFIEEWNDSNKELDNFLRILFEDRKIIINGQHLYCSYLDSVSVFIATNDRSVISQPLQSRMDRVKMVEYNKDEMLQIAGFHAADKSFISDSALKVIADRSRSVPRTVVRALAACERRHHITDGVIDGQQAVDVLETLDIYEHGLNDLDIKILKELYSSDALSLTNLCAITGESAQTVRTQEAFLLKLGFMRITNKRVITPAGRKFLIDNGFVSI